MARKDDSIDILFRRWAVTKRQILGLDPMDADPIDATKGGKCLPSEYLGAVRCTLSERRDLHAGSRSNVVSQHFPEVFTGTSFEVNRAVKHMSPTLQEIVDYHYVRPAPIKVKVHRLGVSWKTYWDRVQRAKTFLEAWTMCIQNSAADV